MRLYLELQVGPLTVTFDPFGQLADAEPDETPDDEPSRGSWPIDSVIERTEDHFPPGLHVGFRGGYYEE